MEYKQRKRLRLQYYDYSQEGAYFITICTRERINVLSEIINGEIVLNEYGAVAEKYINNIKGIERYVIMPDHIHMIIKIDDNIKSNKKLPASKIIPQLIRSFKRMVTREIGFSLFQRSFNDRVIRDETEYFEKCNYMENNPLKWELKNTML